MFFSWLFDTGPSATFLQAAKDGNYDLLHGLLAQKGSEDMDLLKAKDIYECTALHLACSAGHLEVVKLLLMEGADVTATNRFSRTPLHEACDDTSSRSGSLSLQIVQELLDHGAVIEARASGATWTPLHMACYSGNLEIAQLLLQRRANVHGQTEGGSNPLHSASRRGYVDLVRLFIEFKADIESTNNKGQTPLHCACIEGQFKTVELLLELGANIEAKDRQKFTPLHLASSKGCFEVVQLLLDRGANPNAQNFAQCTPLHSACGEIHLEVVILLIDRGANVLSRVANGKTALDLCPVLRGPDPLRQALLSAQNKAIAATAGNNGNNSAIDVATTGDLIFPDAILSSADEERYPLHCAIKYGYEEDIVEAFDEIAYEVRNMRDSQGRTAIDLAALTGQWDMVKYLKEKHDCIHILKPKFVMQSICRQRNDRLDEYLKQVRAAVGQAGNVDVDVENG